MRGVVDGNDQCVAAIHVQHVIRVKVEATEGCAERVRRLEWHAVSRYEGIVNALASAQCPTYAVGVVECKSRSVDVFTENIQGRTPACLVQTKTVDPAWRVELEFQKRRPWMASNPVR